MKWALAAVLGIHGLIHLIGLRKPTGRIAAALWMTAAVLFVGAAAMVLWAPAAWWAPATAALVVSQYLIVQVWDEAKFGSLVNVALLIPVGISMMEAL